MKIKVPTFFRVARLLSQKDRKKLILICLLQVALGFLDLVGVAAIGMVGALSVRGVQSRSAGDKVSQALEILGLSSSSFQTQAAVLALLATGTLVTRTLLSMYITKRTLKFLAIRGAGLSTKIASGVLRHTSRTLGKYSSQEIMFATTSGVDILVIRVLGGSTQLVADSALTLILLLGILFVDFKLALMSLSLFALVFVLLVKNLHQKSEELSISNTNLQIKSNELLWQAIESHRELNVGMRQGFIQHSYQEQRLKYAEVSSGLAFLPNVSKYVIEMALVVGGLIIAASQFLVTDASRAVGSLVVFLAAGSRIAPAVLRIQQSAMQIRGGRAQAQSTIDLLDVFSELEFFKSPPSSPDVLHSGFNPEIQLRNVSFQYERDGVEVLKNISLDIHPGTLNAIVGSSGAGKSTLVDVVLGVLEPSSGEVLISGLKPLESIERFPGAIGYVPQEIHLIQASLKENLTLGYDPDEVEKEILENAINKAQLQNLIGNFQEGLNLQMGEKGVRASGGQKQRIGIARALVSNPKILVLDEATSALDGQTEASIAEELLELRNGITVVVIAHRLSTIKNADQIFYMEDGSIKASGTFSQIRSAIPDFDKQARLLGL